MYQLTHVQSPDHICQCTAPHVRVDGRTYRADEELEVLAREARRMVEVGDRGRVPRSGDKGEVVEIGLVEGVAWDVGEDLDDEFEREVAFETGGTCRGDGVVIGVLCIKWTSCCFCLSRGISIPS